MFIQCQTPMFPLFRVTRYPPRFPLTTRTFLHEQSLCLIQEQKGPAGIIRQMMGTVLPFRNKTVYLDNPLSYPMKKRQGTINKSKCQSISPKPISQIIVFSRRKVPCSGDIPYILIFLPNHGFPPKHLSVPSSFVQLGSLVRPRQTPTACYINYDISMIQ